MGNAWESEYIQDGKPYRPVKKSGVKSEFNHIEINFLDFENFLNRVVGFLLSNGVMKECLFKRDAYEMVYKFYSMQKREL